MQKKCTEAALPEKWQNAQYAAVRQSNNTAYCMF
jgi:hypothetical protein